MRKVLATALAAVSLWVSDAKAQTFTTLDVPGAVSTAASGINNNNQIVGEYFTSIGAPGQGFLYSNGNFTTVDVPGASLTAASGINNSGQIVGSYINGPAATAF